MPVIQKRPLGVLATGARKAASSVGQSGRLFRPVGQAVSWQFGAGNSAAPEQHMVTSPGRAVVGGDLAAGAATGMISRLGQRRANTVALSGNVVNAGRGMVTSPPLGVGGSVGGAGGAAVQQAGPRVQAMQQLGAQNMYGIQSDPRYVQMQADGRPLSSFQLDAPAANRYREMSVADVAGPFAGMSGAYSQQRLLNTGNALGLARTPNVPGEGAGEAIAYRPGAPGSSPFVSDGPLSGGPRGQELQGRIDRMRQSLGVGGPQQPVQRRYGQLGTLVEATGDGGIRMLGPVAQQTMARTGMTSDALAAQRANIIGGTPTTTMDPETGERTGPVRALHFEQQPNMDLRGRRLGDGGDFRDQRFIEGQRRLGRLPSEQEQMALDENRDFQQRRQQLGLQHMESQIELERERVAIERQQAEAAMRQAEAGMVNATNQQEERYFQREREIAEESLRNFIGKEQVLNDRLRANAEAAGMGLSGLPLGTENVANSQPSIREIVKNAEERDLTEADVGKAVMRQNSMSYNQALSRIRELSRIPAASRTKEQQLELDSLEAAQPGIFSNVFNTMLTVGTRWRDRPLGSR